MFMVRKTKRDWLILGLTLLSEEGIEGVTIEALTRRLQMTKGSFYHHFGNHRAYLDSLLNFYEAEGTLKIIEVTEQEETPAGKLRRLLAIIVSHKPERDVAVRSWALHDEKARIVQERVDSQRVAYVQNLWMQLIGDQTQALLRSQILYAILVGSEQIQPPLGAEGLRRLFDEYMRVYRLA